MTITLQTVFDQAQQLSEIEQRQLVAQLALHLQTSTPDELLRRIQLLAAYGILADDPIERPPQTQLEEREALVQ